ncbi:MAG: hypothetical protein WA977_14030 [Halobacteriota archaeon]
MRSETGFDAVEMMHKIRDTLSKAFISLNYERQKTLPKKNYTYT